MKKTLIIILIAFFSVSLFAADINYGIKLDGKYEDSFYKGKTKDDVDRDNFYYADAKPYFKAGGFFVQLNLRFGKTGNHTKYTSFVDIRNLSEKRYAPTGSAKYFLGDEWDLTLPFIEYGEDDFTSFSKGLYTYATIVDFIDELGYTSAPLTVKIAKAQQIDFRHAGLRDNLSLKSEYKPNFLFAVNGIVSARLFVEDISVIDTVLEKIQNKVPHQGVRVDVTPENHPNTNFGLSVINELYFHNDNPAEGLKDIQSNKIVSTFYPEIDIRFPFYVNRIGFKFDIAAMSSIHVDGVNSNTTAFKNFAVEAGVSTDVNNTNIRFGVFLNKDRILIDRFDMVGFEWFEASDGGYLESDESRAKEKNLGFKFDVNYKVEKASVKFGVAIPLDYSNEWKIFGNRNYRMDSEGRTTEDRQTLDVFELRFKYGTWLQLELNLQETGIIGRLKDQKPAKSVFFDSKFTKVYIKGSINTKNVDAYVKLQPKFSVDDDRLDFKTTIGFTFKADRFCDEENKTRTF